LPCGPLSSAMLSTKLFCHEPEPSGLGTRNRMSLFNPPDPEAQSTERRGSEGRMLSRYRCGGGVRGGARARHVRTEDGCQALRTVGRERVELARVRVVLWVVPEHLNSKQGRGGLANWGARQWESVSGHDRPGMHITNKRKEGRGRHWWRPDVKHVPGQRERRHLPGNAYATCRACMPLPL
jgi:hypothetical protein